MIAKPGFAGIAENDVIAKTGFAGIAESGLVRVNLVILLLSMFGLLLTAPGLERGTR